MSFNEYLCVSEETFYLSILEIYQVILHHHPPNPVLASDALSLHGKK